MIQLTPEQIQFLDDVVEGSWSINPENGLVDVDGDVFIPSALVKTGKLPVYFGKVIGDFNCRSNMLTTLEGCPYWVGLDFNCRNNHLTSLKYAPKHINREAVVLNNSFEELDWEPDYVGVLLFSFLGISEHFYSTIIPEIDGLLARGFFLYDLPKYTKCKEEYYKSKMADLV